MAERIEIHDVHGTVPFHNKNGDLYSLYPLFRVGRHCKQGWPRNVHNIICSTIQNANKLGPCHFLRLLSYIFMILGQFPIYNKPKNGQRNRHEHSNWGWQISSITPCNYLNTASTSHLSLYTASPFYTSIKMIS